MQGSTLKWWELRARMHLLILSELNGINYILQRVLGDILRN